MSDTLFRAKAPGIMKELVRDLGITREDAAAILGNIGHECLGFTLMQEVKPLDGGRGGWGWAQWTGSRRVAFEAFCAEHNVAPDSDTANYCFLRQELRGSHKRALANMRAAKTLYDKVVAFELVFEVAGVKHYDRRMKWAELALSLAPPATTPVAPTPASKPSLLVAILTWLVRWLVGDKATPAPAPKPTPAGEPRWLTRARSHLGFKETGANHGIEKFIDGADGVMDGKGIGRLGDPYCAIGVNYCLEMSGVPGTRSAMARSFENHKNFVKLAGPALGAVATFWRGSKTAGTGHVNFYAGTLPDGRHLGLGFNQSDSVNVAAMDMVRHTGWWWPKGEPLPKTGKIVVASAKVAAAGKET